jgi:hypothetical protein
MGRVENLGIERLNTDKRLALRVGINIRVLETLSQEGTIACDKRDLHPKLDIATQMLARTLNLFCIIRGKGQFLVRITFALYDNIRERKPEENHEIVPSLPFAWHHPQPQRLLHGPVSAQIRRRRMARKTIRN